MGKTGSQGEGGLIEMGNGQGDEYTLISWGDWLYWSYDDCNIFNCYHTIREWIWKYLDGLTGSTFIRRTGINIL